MSTSTKPSSTRTLTAMTNTINIPTHSSGMAPNRIRIRTCTKPPCTGTLTFRIFITGIHMDEIATVSAQSGLVEPEVRVDHVVYTAAATMPKTTCAVAVIQSRAAANQGKTTVKPYILIAHKDRPNTA